MPSRPPLLRRVSGGLQSLLGTLLGGLYLIVLYAFTVWLVVGSLSAIQVRDDMREDNESITFADVERSYNRYLESTNTIYAQNHDPLNMRYNDEQARLVGLLDAKMSQIQRHIAPDSQLAPYEFEQSEDYIVASSNCADFQLSPGVSLCTLVNEFATLRSDLDALDAGYYQELERINANFQAQITKAREAEPLAAFFDTYAFFSALYYKEFLKEPPQILVLQLTIVMGMLGSVITMTWSFIKKDSGFTFRRFLILPFVGAMSAFIIFVFVKAGQLTLTAGGASEPLNPFVLSFVGIISGLLSERAYARMSEVGSNFFKIDEDKPRYGIDLRAALEQGGVSETELAGYLKLTDEETTRLLDGKAPATSLQQQLTGACLRRSVRELFTDLPPEAAAAPPKEQHDAPAPGGVPPLQPAG